MEYATESTKAERIINKAIEDYSKRMEEIFKPNTIMMCDHGSKIGYEVRIIRFYFHRGFLVENIKTLCRKWVCWTSLSESPK
jgi:hypothetical protein